MSNKVFSIRQNCNKNDDGSFIHFLILETAAATAASASALASLAGGASPSPGAGEARFFEMGARFGLGLAVPASSLGGGSSSSSAHATHRAAQSAPVARGRYGAARRGEAWHDKRPAGLG